MKQQFNINSWVWVKLNDNGYELLAEIHNLVMRHVPNVEKRNADYYKSQADSNGYTQFQMWSFMQDFGPVTKLQGPPYFENTILFDDKELNPLTT